MDFAQDDESNRGNVRLNESAHDVEIGLSDKSAVHISAVIRNVDDESPELQHLQAPNVTPVHSDEGRENSDAMPTRVSMLNHPGALRMEPRLRVAGKTDVGSRRHACKTPLEILKT